MPAKPTLPAGRPLVIGHRGARAVVPENTLPSFLRAIECGADAIEMDVAISRDGGVMVTHDLIAKRRISRGSAEARTIRRLASDELRRWDCGGAVNPRFPRQCPAPGSPMPLLEEVLELGRGRRINFFIELKTDRLRPRLTPPPREFAQLVMEVVRRGGFEARCVLMSFDLRILRELETVAPDISRARLYSMRMRSIVRMAADAGCDTVAPHVSLVTRRRVANAHVKGLKVVPWTANRPAVWQRLLRAGVDGIVTDDPGGLWEFLDGIYPKVA